MWPAVQSSNFIFVSDILLKMLFYFRNLYFLEECDWSATVEMEIFIFFMDKAHYILRLITKLHRRNERTVMNLFETNLNSF